MSLLINERIVPLGAFHFLKEQKEEQTVSFKGWPPSEKFPSSFGKQTGSPESSPFIEMV